MTAGFENHATKQLNQVVFPGTHDAGIFGNMGKMAKTQSLDIGGQADAGVRYFDLRIITTKTTVKTNLGEKDMYSQKAYHAPGFKEKAGGQHHDVKMKALAGVGGKLDMMLQQAASFVHRSPNEFLILRFSKSGHMDQVAQKCIDLLGNYHYKGSVNLNTQQVGTLAGKVITLFDEPDWSVLPFEYSGPKTGILPVKSLYDGDGSHKGYNPNLVGMQYFGKYSNTATTKKNISKQKKIFASGAKTDPDVLGMMYWTLTSNMKQTWSLPQSIKKRDRKMWQRTSNGALQKTWESGLKESIMDRFGGYAKSVVASVKAGVPVTNDVRAFMPNIVMMDFADSEKCKTIWSLNNIRDQQVDLLNEDLAQVEYALM